MRLIIAGGRDFKPQPYHIEWLDRLRNDLSMTNNPIEQVVCGMAPGADMFGAKWAREQLPPIPVAEFPANWATFGRDAGPIRNKKMARHAMEYSSGGVVLLPGGSGTRNMAKVAADYGLKIWDWRERKLDQPPVSRGEIVGILEKPDE